MRDLTPQQKKELKRWFKKNYDGGYKFDMAEKIAPLIYNNIEKLHPTEVFYQNANHYLEELVENGEPYDKYDKKDDPQGASYMIPDPEITDTDREELVRQIAEGYTSGRLDSDGKHIAWSLETEVWNDDS